MTPYFLVLVQEGFEKLLKEEVARFSSQFHFAFSRPGFVTFKAGGGELNIDQLKSDWVWARTSALSYGKKSIEELNELVDELPSETRISVFHRDTTRLLDIELSAAGLVSREGSNDREALIIQVDPGVYYWGLRKRLVNDFPMPGNRLFNPETVELKTAAVTSRAYYKLREAMHWVQAELSTGDRVVEVGCAPGGASVALLEKGAEVWGVDPGQMDPVVLENSRFHWIKKPMSFVEKSDLPKEILWWVVDMNVAPQAVLSVIEPWIRHNASIQRLFLTLKMNELQFAAEIPKFIQKAKSWGFTSVAVRQLPSNKQEVCLMGFRKVN